MLEGSDVLKNYLNILRRAQEGKYAIPAFNYSDIWELEAILEAAAEERAEVYVASNMRTVNTLGIKYLGALGEKAYEHYEGHVLNHLDHSTSVDLCIQAIDNGYHSVMIDASMSSLEENIEKVRAVVKYAHEHEAIVEAEVGRILGRNEEGTYSGNDFLVQVPDAVKLVEETGVDSLAIGIGTQHGFYKETPNISIQRLKEVRTKVSIPLVLHGGTGVPYEIVRECIANGMAKVNIGTLLHATYLDKLRTEIGSYSGAAIADVMEPVRDAVKERVKELIRVCSANNRY